jgi:hypothetical protein
MIASVGRSQGRVVKSKADLCNQDAKGKAEKDTQTRSPAFMQVTRGCR